MSSRSILSSHYGYVKKNNIASRQLLALNCSFDRIHGAMFNKYPDAASTQTSLKIVQPMDYFVQIE